MTIRHDGRERGRDADSAADENERAEGEHGWADVYEAVPARGGGLHQAHEPQGRAAQWRRGHDGAGTTLKYFFKPILIGVNSIFGYFFFNF